MKGWVVILAVLALLLSSCGSNEVSPQEKEEPIILEETPEQTQPIGGENMPKILFIISQSNFRDEEYFKPKEILEKAGYSTDVASITTEHAIGMLGALVKPDLAVKDVNVNDYGLIVIVGGSGAPELAKKQEVLNLLSQAKADNIKLGAICLGPMVLAKAGVLQGKNATVYQTPESVAALEAGGASFVDKSLVTDAGLVTANGPGAATEFGNALVRLLQS